MEITAENLKTQWESQRGICPYTGWKLVLRSRKGGKRLLNHASVDRIDSSRGYFPDNIQFVALMANYAKNSFEEKSMIAFCNAVAATHNYWNTEVGTEEEMKLIDETIKGLDRWCPITEPKPKKTEPSEPLVEPI